MSSCPVETFVCQAAATVRGMLEQGDLDALFASGQPASFTCPETAGQLDPLAPLCAGAAVGDIRSGYWVARLQSDGGVVVQEAAARKIVEEFLALGGRGGIRGAIVRTTAVGCNTDDHGVNCADRSAVVLVPGGVNAGVTELLAVIFSGSEHRVIGFWSGVTQSNDELVLGGTYPLSLALGRVGTTRFFPYSLP